MLFVSVLLFYFTTVHTAPLENNNNTLQLVHILFRHGDRTNIRPSLYPKNPHINHTYYPYGLGELTNRGKRREFQLGRALRARYDAFLGRTYTPSVLEATSSNRNRTKASLQLVLAGLFPPEASQAWQDTLPWQPIPFNFLPAGQDRLFYGVHCPSAKTGYANHLKTEAVLDELDAYAEIVDFMRVETGWDHMTPDRLLLLYIGLMAEEENGLALPEWTKKVYPAPLDELALKTYFYHTATEELRQLVFGHLLKKIVDDSRGRIEGALVPEGRKLFLYSGHEFNVECLLIGLGVFDAHLPPYGASLALELHKIEGVYGFKVLYGRNTGDLEVLTIPKCKSFCPFDRFVELMGESLPKKDLCGV